ncbi:hypothetical protein H2201_003618 [Coniosporium apollinis]|uniref:BTB domain-containing protein n=1 Tax=Coniosporium apollinis TaxID=61459 RepID=A0ABQ9NY10_9PEZI|nr:hypothetical protein H2201_003618 [Coniosporium apollinis]
MSPVSDMQTAKKSVELISGDTTAQTEDSDVNMVQGTPRKLPAVESCSSVTSPEEDKRLETSPYISEVCLLRFGSANEPYTVLETFLQRHPGFTAPGWKGSAHSSRPIKLPKVDQDTGHTLVHYLYTGTYQTLRPKGVSLDAIRIIEYKRSVLAYCAARRHGLPGLASLAKRNIKNLDKEISIFEFLDIASEACQKLPKTELWFSEFVQARIKAVLEANEDLLADQNLLGRIGKVAASDKTLMTGMVKTYVDKIAGEASKKRAFEEHSDDEAPRLELRRSTA